MSTDRNFRAQKSVCPFCGVGCGVEYSEKSGKGTGWKGPVNTKGEMCPKGAAAFDFVDHEDRLTQPLVREDGELVPASWEEALGRVESELGGIVDEYGADAIGFFASSNATNEENYVYQKLARMLGTNNVDNCARLCHSSTVAAMSERFGAGAMTNTLDDLTEADVYLVAGANPAEQHPVAFRSYFLPAIRDGGEMIHVDPRENSTTDAAGIHLPVRPGYDIPLFNAMAAAILEEGLEDEEFLAERVSNVEEFKAHIERIDVEENAKLAGVDPEELREAARTYAEADRAAIFTGMGMSQHHCGTDNVHSLLNLSLLTGNVGRRGTGVNPLRGQNNVQGAGDVGALPNILPGYEPVEDDEARERVAEVWGVEPPATPGLTEVEFTHEFGDGVKGAFVFGENPAVTEPHSGRVEEEFQELDFLVVLDLFETETAEHADVLLPGSSWAEKSGTVTNTDRQVIRMRPNADLPGDARLDLEIISEIGARLTDRPEAFDYDGPGEVFDEITEVSPIYDGMSYDGIGESSQRWPFSPEDGSGTAVLHREEFSTGEKTAPLVPLEHVPPADELEEDELALTTGRVLQHFNSGALSRRSETLMRMRGEDVLQIHPADAEPRGIEDGDLVRVENERGDVEVEAAVTPAVREGAVFLTFHYADPLTNALTGDALDPVAKIPEYKHSGVSVAPVDD
ncbi:Anaerobic dehydrogenase [Halalkaliarchaeum sp. AArc-CO]|uniref:formate dehydrogenase subunit alpha n=1 Tax=unclassified Halalkaliarchaeum TaxID=2678344 RepID=UPI00217E39D9|nr:MULTISPECIES: formate dehydrogenase subunit alpha [unclassified Halalkaliarchaeum]MDR5673393.1 formate dehydrogenase subunit alpha [Halalkaliarchaeum sp. AArc-GB]UWG49734.1 Anaerobic dehydrogenase [Halalkaliarchaeum sp. AArc-CO]